MQFTPLDFKGLVGWFDGRDTSTLFDATSGGSLPAYGSSVARWENKATANHATQATAGFRPIRSTAPIVGVRNLVDRSEEFDNAYWTKTRSSVTANATTAPDGTITAEKLIEDTTASNSHYVTTPSISTTGLVTFSVYAKSSERTHIGIYHSATSAQGRIFNLSTGTVEGNIVANPTASTITPIGNGWYRCSITVNKSASGGFWVQVANSNTSAIYTGDGTSGIFIWGAQLEVGSLTNYQRRTTQHEVYEQGVPNRDYLWFDGSNDFYAANGLASIFHGNDTPFTVVAVARPRIGTSSGVLASYGTLASGDFRGEFRLTGSSGSRLLSAFRKDSGVEVSAFSTSSYVNEQSGIFSKVFKGQTVDFGYDGTLVLNSGSLNKDTLGTNPDRFVIGARSYSSTDIYFTGDYYALLIFDKALTNADRKRIEAWASDYYSVASIPAPQGIAAVPSVQLYIDFSRPETLFNATSGGSLVAPDGAIARAEDLSGNDFHATQGTAGNRPVRKVDVLNGLDVARFTAGSKHFLDLGTQLATTKPANWTVLGAAVTDNVNIPQSILCSGNAASNSHAYWGNLSVRGYDNGRVDSACGDGTNGTWRNTTNVTMINNEWAVFAARYTTGSNNINIYKNGVSNPTTIKFGGANTTSGGTAFPLRIGRLGEFDGYYWRRDISTIIVADTDLPDSHINYIHSLLGEQFALDAPFITERKNLVISYPNVAKNSAMIATNQTWNILKNHWNLYRGNRYHYAELAGASSSPREWVFTLNEAQTVDHIILARADLLVASGDTNIRLEFSNDGTLWQESWIDTITSAKLTGIRNQDFVVNTYNFGNRPYWRFTITGGTGVTQFSKLYIGKAFDFGVNTSSINDRIFFPNQQRFIGTSGSAYLQQVESGRNIINLTFDGVTDAEADRFISEIASMQNTHQGVFLWNPNETRLLNQNVLIHCRIVDWSKKDVLGFPNWNQITIELEELLG